MSADVEAMESHELIESNIKTTVKRKLNISHCLKYIVFTLTWFFATANLLLSQEKSSEVRWTAVDSSAVKCK